MTTTGASFLFFNMITCLVGSADLIAPRVFALYPVKAIYYISFFFSFLYYIEVLNTDVLLAYR
jgi:nucleoside permease NupC